MQATKTARHVRIRFNLSHRHFMQWQIKTAEGVEHYDPASVTLTLHGAKLRNQPATARKIHGGDHKTVCAWVDCESVTITPATDPAPNGTPCEYNPRIAPFWRVEGKNADNTTHARLVSSGRRLYIA